LQKAKSQTLRHHRESKVEDAIHHKENLQEAARKSAKKTPLKRVVRNRAQNSFTTKRRTFMSGRLAGKVAIVTRLRLGIGQAIAIRLAGEGASIVVDYRNHLDQAQENQIKPKPPAAKPSSSRPTVSILTDTQNLVDQAYQQLARCDILVNNAGIEIESPFWDVTEKTTTPSSTSPQGRLLLTQAFVRRLRDAKLPAASSTSAPSTKTWSSPTSPPTASPSARE